MPVAIRYKFVDFTFMEVGLEVLNDVQVFNNYVNRGVCYFIYNPTYKIAIFFGFFFEQDRFVSV